MSDNAERSGNVCSSVVTGDDGKHMWNVRGRNQTVVSGSRKLVLSMPQLKKKVPFKVCSIACVCRN